MGVNTRECEWCCKPFDSRGSNNRFCQRDCRTAWFNRARSWAMSICDLFITWANAPTEIERSRIGELVWAMAKSFAQEEAVRKALMVQRRHAPASDVSPSQTP